MLNKQKINYPYAKKDKMKKKINKRSRRFYEQ